MVNAGGLGGVTSTRNAAHAAQHTQRSTCWGHAQQPAASPPALQKASCRQGRCCCSCGSPSAGGSCAPPPTTAPSTAARPPTQTSHPGAAASRRRTGTAVLSPVPAGGSGWRATQLPSTLGGKPRLAAWRGWWPGPRCPHPVAGGLRPQVPSPTCCRFSSSVTNSPTLDSMAVSTSGSPHTTWGPRTRGGGLRGGRGAWHSSSLRWPRRSVADRLCGRQGTHIGDVKQLGVHVSRFHVSQGTVEDDGVQQACGGGKRGGPAASAGCAPRRAWGAIPHMLTPTHI